MVFFEINRRRRLGLGCAAAIVAAAGAGLALVIANQGHAAGSTDTLQSYKQALLANNDRPAGAVTPADAATANPVTTTPPVMPADQSQILKCNAEGCSGVEVTFPTALFLPTTQYTFDNGKQLLVVWAGSDGADSSRGGVRVQITADADGSAEAGSGVFYPSTDVGPMTITGVSGQDVSLAYSGGTGTFSLGSDTFSLATS